MKEGNKPEKTGGKSSIAEKEERILKFWKENDIFNKTLEKPDPKGDFVFYDGPPFATGLPHYGHILAGTIKDVIPRFETMRGKRVVRKWGWDCHGLPVENLIEKELGLKNKKDIETLGVEKFNEAARASVLRYDSEWKKIVPRSGRWVDMDDAYLTMNPPYMESVWWSFKTLWERGLVYEGYKVMPYCPHCGTTLSNLEVALGYKDISDISVYAKFELENEPRTFVIAWTTTPWTLPGNVALAVNPEITYKKIQMGDEKLVVAEQALKKEVFAKAAYEAIETLKGSDLIGKKYKPAFPFYSSDQNLKNKENGWKIYGADFVTTEDGTGVVHIAPAFGEDDYELSKKYDLPLIQHVDTSGKFKSEVAGFEGMDVKPKSDEEKTRLAADILIIKYLQEHGTFFAKEKLAHSYPHCWRCETPLLNYATSSWFVSIAKLKDRMISENKKVEWIPKEIGEGRFGKWLEGARDWAISRSRYWGSTLPVWKCEECKKVEVVGSIEELKKKTNRENVFTFVRHGEAEHNVKNICSGNPDDPYHLTEKGREEVMKTAHKLKGKKFDAVYVSPFVRAQETAAIITETLGISKGKITVDERLREFGWGDFNGKPYAEYLAYEKEHIHSFDDRLPGGESYQDAKNRTGNFLYEVDSTFERKQILVVAHGLQLEVAPAIVEGADKIRSKDLLDNRNPSLGGSEEIKFAALPHNRDFELDLHRPYVDEVKWKCKCGGEMKKIPDVFDTWYESGSMPYGQAHYPFEHKDTFDPEKGMRYPADFIAEGLDQTRGWFYTLLALGVGLFGKTPYQKVLVNGLVLAEDGQKMSKSKQNYPEIAGIFDRYGADALRFYMLSSPIVKGEELKFSERGLDDVMKKLVMRLDNVCSFYEMYKSDAPAQGDTVKSENVLDRWVLVRLSELGLQMTKGFEALELDRAVRPIADFIDDLSTWYLRRSRERFKGDDMTDRGSVLMVTAHVLREFAKLLAPVMPFIAEDVYLRASGEKESVHLEEWPHFKGERTWYGARKSAPSILEEMAEVRRIVSLGLEARSREGVKVRQPLVAIAVKDTTLMGKDELVNLITDELNVKHVIFDADLAEEVKLDTDITPELKEEGQVREYIRMIQDLRKSENLNPKDEIALEITIDEEGKALIEKNKEQIMKAASIKDVAYCSGALAFRVIK